MTAKERDLVKHLAKMPEPAVLDAIDPDEMVREMLKNLGISAKKLRTAAQLAAFRKRSTAAKLGWRRRKKR